MTEDKQNVEEVTRHVKKEVERELWARSAGRCQFRGCNRILYTSPITQEKVNISEKAHIYSFSENGPRGRGIFKQNPKHLNSISNLMLMCHDCHKTIDQDKDGSIYSASLLKQWKEEHEYRVEFVTGIDVSCKTHVVFYCSNIDEQKPVIQKQNAIGAMFPMRYPVSPNPIDLSMKWANQDNKPEFWTVESDNLKKVFNREIVALNEQHETKHFSVFALAPMPLLILLGTLFTDKTDVDVYQPIRKPKGWRWQEFPKGFEFIINSPNSQTIITRV